MKISLKNRSMPMSTNYQSAGNCQASTLRQMNWLVIPVPCPSQSRGKSPATSAPSDVPLSVISLHTSALILASVRSHATGASIDLLKKVVLLVTSVFIQASVRTPATSALIDALKAAISLCTSEFTLASVHTHAVSANIEARHAAIS